MTPRRDDEDAISNVLGAILVFGLLVMTLVLIQVKFVPVWTEEREADHVDTVVDQLALFKADTERLATNATGGSVADPLSVTPEGGFSFFTGGAAQGGEAAFTPSSSGEGIQLTSPQLRVTQRSGIGLYALGEKWDQLSTGELENITEINHLRVRVVEPTSQANGASATVEVRDADDDFAGKVVIRALRDPPDDLIVIEVYNATDQTNAFTLESQANHQSTTQDYQYFNLLDDELLFNQVLAAAETPFSLVLTQNGLDTEYTTAYTTVTGGSAGGSGGLLIPNYNNTLSSGALSFATNNQRLPSQRFVMEHGGILVVQPDGAAMMVAPTLNVLASDDQVVVRWVVPGLDGSSSGVSGVRSASLLASQQGANTNMEALAAQVNFTIPTEYPAVWDSFLTDTMESAGLSDSGTSPQFTVTNTTSTVTLRVFGPVTATATEDVFLRYQQATIAVELRPTG